MKKKTRVIIASHLYHPAKGGAENLAQQIVGYFSLDEYIVKVVTTEAFSTEAFFLNDKRRVDKKESVNDKIEVFRMSFSRKFRKTLNFIFSVANRIRVPYFDYLKIYRFGPRNRKYYKKIISERPDIIIALPFPMLNTVYAFKAAKKLGVPLILVPCFHINDKFSFRNKLLFRILKETDMVIALTESEQEFFIKGVGVNKDRTVVISPGIEILDEIKLESKESLKKKLGIKEKNVVLFLGQHGKHKKILELIMAMKYVLDHYPDTALVIAGGTTEYTKIIKTKAEVNLKAHPNGNCYFFDNFIEGQKNVFYKISDLFISLSEYESFGIVFIEAMRNGLPVIGSKNSVVRSIFDDFKHGLLVNPKKKLDIANAIIDILENEEIRIEYSRNVRTKVELEFDKNIVRDKTLGVLKHALNRAK